MWEDVGAMLRYRESAELRRCQESGRKPRRRMTRDAVVEWRGVLNAPVFSEVSSALNGVDILIVEDGRATAPTARKCTSHGIEMFDSRCFRLPGGFAAHCPEHRLVATAAAARDYVAEHFRGLTLEHMPRMQSDDPGARYFGAEPGELWHVDGGDPGLFPPRLVVPP